MRQGYAYDLVGNRTQLVEPDGTVTLYEFDGVYRLNKVHENYRPDQRAGNDVNAVTAYGYDRRGLLTSTVNPNGAETKFEHNGVEKLVKEVDPLGKVWEYGYDGDRNRTSRKDAKGDLTEYEFYPDDMLEQISYADGSSVSYEYDPNNNRTGMTDKLGTTAWSFDSLNRTTQQKDPFERILQYRYDADSNRIGMTYPDGNKVAYQYSPNSWLRKMTDPKGQVITYSRDLVGNTIKIANPNKTETTVAYDKVYRTLNRVNRQTTNGGKINSAYWHTYNKLGNITKTTNQYGWRKPSVVQETYSYDGLHRLAGFSLYPLQNNGGTVTETWNYDPAGNRLSWKTNDDLQTNTPFDAFSRTYEYNEANQMLAMVHDAGKKSKNYAYGYSYDENGNRINRQLADANGPQYGVDYSYDPENRLVEALDYQLTGKNGKNRIDRAVTSLEYDGGGRRLVQHYDPKNGGGGVDKRDEYVFDGLDPVAEYDKLNGQRTDYYRGEDGNIALMHQYKGGTQGEMYWYHYNYKKDVVGLTKQNGNSHHNYRYEPYGAVLPENGNFTDPHNHYTLTGKEFDENTGLVWFGARHYEPETGVWMGQDSYRGRLNQPMSLHRFGYVSNNPVNRWDYYGFSDENWLTATNKPTNWLAAIEESDSTKECRAESYFPVKNPEAEAEQEQNGDNSKLWIRVGGALQAIGGCAESIAGFTFALATIETGIGPVAGTLVGLHGADQAHAGLEKLITGKDVDTLTSQGIQKAGVSRDTANLVDNTISIVDSVGIWMATSRATTKAATALKNPSQVKADELQGIISSQRPNTVAVLEHSDGAMTYGVNQEGIYNSTVREVLNKAPQDCFNGECAEINAISKALNDGKSVEGAEISVSNIRGAGSTTGIHGTPKAPCETCTSVLDYFNIKINN